MDIKYHKSCTTLPIYNFYKIMDDMDLRFLIIGYSEFDSEDVEITADAEIVLNLIIEEYAGLTENNEVNVNLGLQILVIEQEFERDTLVEILDIFKEFEDSDVLGLLSEFGFNINVEDDLDKQLSMVIKRIKGLNNKIRINKSKYATRFKKANEEIKRNLDKEALMLEMNLKLGREINTRTTSVSKWVSMLEMSREQSLQLQKSRTK